MFRFKQIISATDLQRNFDRIAKKIAQKPQAFLITREKARHLVLVDAESFDDLIEYRYRANRLEYGEIYDEMSDDHKQTL